MPESTATVRTVGQHLAAKVDRRVLVDGAVVAAVCGLLVAIHFLMPTDVQARLAFDHEAFRPWTLVTSAYVHASDVHLANNILGFLVAFVVAYGLCWELGERDWVRPTVFSFLVFLPIAVNLTSYGVLGLLAPDATPTGRGFSGIGAGVVGFCFAALLVWIETQASRRVTIYVGEGIVLLLAWELSVIYRGFHPVVLGIVGGGAGLVAWGIIRATGVSVIGSRWRETLPEVLFGLGIVTFLAGFVYGLFPADFVGGSTTTNIFAHAAGFVYGAGGSLLLRRWRRTGLSSGW